MNRQSSATENHSRGVTILSIFPGIDLFGRAFTQSGFCVVKGPDLILGEDIRDFKPCPGVFAGVIGGPPCQDFSALKRVKGDYSNEMLKEYVRVVEQSQPDWWLLENVVGVPDVKIDGYGWQRFGLDLGWFTDKSRLRHFQFGHKSGIQLDVMKGSKGDITGTAALANDSRSFAELCAIQGLGENFKLPDFNVIGRKKAVGNGVPLILGAYLASTIALQVYGRDTTARDNRDYTDGKRCSCECGSRVYGKASYASSACRKKAQRKREKTI